MKAKFVHENLKFTKEEHPYDALDIGKKITVVLDNAYGYTGPIRNKEAALALVDKVNGLMSLKGKEAEEMGIYDDHAMDMTDEVADEYEEEFEKIGFYYDDEYEDEDVVNENINFERGKDPKVSMGIGKAANPIHILSMEEEQWEQGRVQSLDDVEAANQNTWSNPLDDEHEIDFILSNWEEEIDPFYSFWVGDPDDPDFYHPSELEGEFVEYNGNIYEIPKTNLFKTIADTSPQPA